jgi:hypothetical protein
MKKDQLRLTGILVGFFMSILVYWLERILFWERSEFQPNAYIIYAMIKVIIPFVLSLVFGFWRRKEELFKVSKGWILQLVYVLNVILIIINGTTVWVLILLISNLLKFH